MNYNNNTNTNTESLPTMSEKNNLLIGYQSNFHKFVDIKNNNKVDIGGINSKCFQIHCDKDYLFQIYYDKSTKLFSISFIYCVDIEIEGILFIGSHFLRMNKNQLYPISIETSLFIKTTLNGSIEFVTLKFIDMNKIDQITLSNYYNNIIYNNKNNNIIIDDTEMHQLLKWIK